MKKPPLLPSMLSSTTALVVGSPRHQLTRPGGGTTGDTTVSAYSCSVEFPDASVAATVTSNAPGTVEAPVTAPTGERVMPGGSAPAETAKLTGTVPRTVASCWV